MKAHTHTRRPILDTSIHLFHMETKNNNNQVTDFFVGFLKQSFCKQKTKKIFHVHGWMDGYLWEVVLDFEAFSLEFLHIPIGQVLGEEENKETDEDVHSAGHEEGEAPRGEPRRSQRSVNELED